MYANHTPGSSGPVIFKLSSFNHNYMKVRHKTFTICYVGTPVSVLLLAKWKLHSFFFYEGWIYLHCTVCQKAT
jgi:hypothetical protein